MPDLATLLLWAFWTLAGVFVGFHVAITAAIRDVERWEYENRAGPAESRVALE